MTPVMLGAAAIQWASGLILSFIIFERARRRGTVGLWPGVLAAFAIFLFLLSAVEVSFVLAGAEHVFVSWLPRDFTSSRWQLVGILVVCGGAWVFLMLASVVNALLGVRERQRAAAAEIRRRTDRALGGLDRPAPVAPPLSPPSDAAPSDRLP
ncbi:MAG: hypothetical protein WKG32_06860 [Gemmatimonadaceae bacterium]